MPELSRAAAGREEHAALPGLRPDQAGAVWIEVQRFFRGYCLLGELTRHVLGDLARVPDELRFEVDSTLVGQNHD